MSRVTGSGEEQTLNRRQELFVSWVFGSLVDIVVLSLFVEHFDSVVIDSFSIAILTAVVLRALLYATLKLEHRVGAFFKAHPSAVSSILRLGSAWIILFASKFVILEVIDVIFGEHVELGGFLMIIALAAAMVVAEKALLRIYERL